MLVTPPVTYNILIITISNNQAVFIKFGPTYLKFGRAAGL